MAIDEKELARRARIQAHNAAIYAQIQTKQTLIGKYDSVKASANAIIGSIDSYIQQLKSANELLEYIIVTGKNGNGPVGEGKLVSEDCSTLSSLSSTFAEIVSACGRETAKLEQEIQSLRSQLMSI